MARNRSLRTSITKLLLLAAVLSVICMIPSFAQPPQVSAQTCPYGETSYYYPGTGYTCTGGTTTSGINCGTYVSYNGTCNGVNSQYQVNCGSYV